MATLDTVNYLGSEYGHRFFDSVMLDSREGKAVAEAMERLGLTAQRERTHIFSIFSPENLRSIAISVTPFSNKDLSMEGGLSVSEGGHAQGVVVELKRRKIVAFRHLTMEGGKLKSERFDVGRLAKAGSSSLAQRAGQIKTARPLVELNVRHAASLSSLTYANLLTDEFARSVYSQADITELRGQANLVTDIGRFVLLRTSGSSCCSCSTSCWGSCSSSCSYVK